MKGYNFTERLRKVLALAREAAEHRNHERLDTEHILLGMIEDGGGVAVAALQNLGVRLNDLERAVDALATSVPGASPSDPELPYTSRAKKVLELAMDTASSLDHNYVGTEHVLIGLLREEKGIAARVLREAGATVENAIAEVLRLPGSIQSNVVAIKLEVSFENGSIVRQTFRNVGEAIAFLRENDTKLPRRTPIDGELSRRIRS